MNTQELLRHWKTQRERFDALSPRERGLILATLLVTLHFAWDGLFWQPLQERQQRLAAGIGTQQARIGELNAKVDLGVQLQARDPDQDAGHRLAKLEAELAGQETAAKALEMTLIEPGEVAVLLERMLGKVSGLTLVRLQGLASEPLADAKKPVPGKEPEGMRIYRHSFEIEFEGDYFSTLNYLKVLQALPWRFFWDRLEYEVKSHPAALIRLRLHTLSLSKEWLGV